MSMTVDSSLAQSPDAQHLVMRQQLQITGLVQGVGFRPFIYRTATRHRLNGFVMNNGAGVLVEVEGLQHSIRDFIACIYDSAPSTARIQSIQSESIPLLQDNTFRILESNNSISGQTSISPDQAICDDCIADINDPSNQRYRYPFTNCAICGPRFSIIATLPYDRSGTSMQSFSMCPSCQGEYDDPDDRRFHAETICCPACGPELMLTSSAQETIANSEFAIAATARLLEEGSIVAIKGLGGYQLAVDARNRSAVTRLRQRKQREAKPLALMVSDLEMARFYCHVSDAEKDLLCSAERPIVLLKKKPEASAIAAEVAPNNPYLGIMLPTTPLHYLIASDTGFPVVMTSANLSDETMLIKDQEAFSRLSDIADAFLFHDREILRPVDDSVARICTGKVQVLRLARGYAPFEVIKPGIVPGVVAMGGHIKSTLAFTRKDAIILGQHIGDLDSVPARENWHNCYDQLLDLYSITPAYLISDLHPDYYSSRIAEQYSLQFNLPDIRLQHHVSHLSACMAEHNIESPVLGVTWDGNGFGIDGKLWGGEFISIEGTTWTRLAHLREFPLPGGSKAMREPHRSAIGMLYEIFGGELIHMEGLPPLKKFTGDELELLLKALERGVNSPLTSSSGRLFDGVSALLGLAEKNSYEGQAACQLEWIADQAADIDAYDFSLLDSVNGKTSKIVDWETVIRQILADIGKGIKPSHISAAFHAGLAAVIVDVARDIGIKTVLLSGGCFQNVLLTECCRNGLEQAGFTVYTHQFTTPGDGCLALGQAAWASRLAGEGKI